MRVTLAMTAVFALATLGAAPAPKAKPAPAPAAPAPMTGYLADAPPDTLAILPPAPTPGTTRYESDRTIFLSTRRLEGSPRWKMAQGDDNSGAILKHLACAVGVELTPQNAPTLARMLPRVGRDATTATNRPKDFYKRQRPYLVDEGPICIAKSDLLAKSPDYPSGHATWGWTVGLIVAELAPDRAAEVLARARAFGDSRMVCGVHNNSAVESARTNGAAVVAALHGSEAFRKDLDAARKEVAAARKAGPAPDAAACAAEAELVAQKLY